MCGRYTLYETDKIQERFGTAGPMFKLHDSYNVAPGQLMPVVVRAGEDKRSPVRTIELMKWGLIPHWAKDPKIGYRMINARAESVFEKPAWRGPIKYRRCLIPAHGFYEWQRTDSKTKQPYFIRPEDQELFAFAGMYDTWTDPAGGELWSFTICTTNPNKEMRAIHDRMPVILSPDEEDGWLDPSHELRGDIEPYLHPYPDGRLQMHPVSTEVNVVHNNDSRLIYPLDSA